MSVRQWCPMIWLDEVVGVAVADPSECVRWVDGQWLLTDDDWRDTNGAGGLSISLTPGELVLFGYSECLGRIEIVKHDDGGGFTHVGSTPIPTDATSWWVPGDPDTQSDTLGELVREYMEAGSSATAEAYRWAFHIPLVFLVEDGKGRFVQLEGGV